MRQTILNLHLYTALIAGIFVVVLGVTGSIMAFEDDLDRLFNPGLYKVQPTAGQPLPMAELKTALEKAYPRQRFVSFRIAPRPDQAWIAAARGLQVFVDPYTARPTGTRTGPTTLAQIHQLHLRLLLGKPGGTIVCAVSLVLIWLIGSGIYLWWPLKRASVKFGASLRRVSFDAHNAVGIYSAAFLLVLSVTGVVVHFDDEIGSKLNKMTHSPEPLRSVPSIAQPGAKPIASEAALVSAQAALPGAVPIAVNLPAGPKASYLIPMRFPEDLTPGGRSWVVVDQYSGRPLFVGNSRTAAPGAKTILENRAIHTGDILGYPSKILMSLSSLMLVVQAITGYYMWWKKLRVRERDSEAARASESLA